MLDRSKLPFVLAKYFTDRKTKRTIKVIVIHVMEAPKKSKTAENVANYFANPDRKASAHYCVDNNSIVHCVQEKDVAWGAPGANNSGIHIEHAGYTNQSEADWTDEYGTAMMELSAELAASIANTYDIPITWLTSDQIKAGQKGFTGHKEVSVAYNGTHEDPGPGFPTHTYLELVRAAAASG